MTTRTKANVKQATLDWHRAPGWQLAYGPDVAAGLVAAEASVG